MITTQSLVIFQSFLIKALSMHYYKRNIGDYHKKAGRLSILQHGAYTLLIDACYDREVFPTLEEAVDWVWASSDLEVDAVTFVLKKFFIEEDGLFIQGRIKEDLDKYHGNCLINKQIAIDRENKKKQTKGKGKSTKRERVVNDNVNSSNEAPPNQEPLTTNQEPLTINQSDQGSVSDRKLNPEDVSFATWFYERLVLINPKQKKPTKAVFEKWADVIRLIRVADNKTYQEMSDLFMWVNSNEFWKGNILSPAKFRKHWDMLIIQMDKEAGKKDINAISTNFDAPEDWNNE